VGVAASGIISMLTSFSIKILVAKAAVALGSISGKDRNNDIRSIVLEPLLCQKRTGD
jgi:hypothetical protein